MSEGRIIRDLLKTHVLRDEDGFRRAAKDLIDRERSLNHRVFADDLERIFYNGTNGSTTRPIGKPDALWEIPKDKDKGFPLLTVTRPDVPWERLILPPPATQQLEAVANENHRRDLLLAGGMKPKQKVLLVGPPGCGKTLAASVVATALSWPLATVRLDTVISSFLGETATNLRRIFDFIGQDRFVVLFDEFDALGKERDRGQEHGELQRVVTALLQLMDSYQGESVMIFATNHQFMLDSALWRRFDSIVPFALPKQQDRLLMLRMFLRAFGHTDEQLKMLAQATEGASGSDIEWIVSETIRRLLLDGRRQVEKSDLEQAISGYQLRMDTLSEMGRNSETLGRGKRKGKSTRHAA